MGYRLLILITLLGLASLDSTSATAQEPTWNGNVIAVGPQRQQITSKAIVKRPYRPLHFYGNTVRRRHYRGTAVPLPKDFFGGFRALLFTR